MGVTASPTIAEMDEIVRAALGEFDYAMALHEAWKPAAVDVALHARLNNSYAANTFNVVRVAVRRELLMTLARLWDSQSKAINLARFADWLRSDTFIDRLIAHRKYHSREASIQELFRADLERRSEITASAIAEFKPGGRQHAHLKRLLALRGQTLGHHQMVQAKAYPPTLDEKDVEAIYVGSAEIIDHLMSIINATAITLLEGAEVQERYAKSFWASVRGERTEGHPDYRPPDR